LLLAASFLFGPRKLEMTQEVMRLLAAAIALG
jgi:hypothetical protein